MGIEVSIIMNSYNKYPLNLLSLYALENQIFDHNKMEVILVDDASTDRTPILRNYQSSFPFRYLRLDENTGRSKAKNIGVEASQGKTLIILDAEMIVEPHFVGTHAKYHQSEEDLVVTGCLRHNRVYSILDKEMNAHQIKHFYSLIRSKPNILRKFGLSPTNHIKNLLNIRNKLIKRSQIPLLSKQTIQNKRYRLLAAPYRLRPEVIKIYGKNYKGYHLPWYNVITHNISLPRKLYDKVGPFYEGFTGWGFEDWEFGYRLYHHGARFLDDDRAPVYHQEHPYSVKSQQRDNLINYQKFLERHPHFDVGIHTLFLLEKLDFLTINPVVDDYKKMEKHSPNNFEHLKKAFMELFSTIATLLVEEKPIENLLKVSGIEEKKNRKERILSEYQELKNSNKYPHLAAAFNTLLEF